LVSDRPGSPSQQYGHGSTAAAGIKFRPRNTKHQAIISFRHDV
jgi:hypothetical protein